MSFNYLGVDWFAMAFTLCAIYLLGDKKRAGFVVMICGNSCWIAVGYLSSSLAMMIANVVFLAMNLRGYLRWSNQEPDAAA
jgi:nicotinamide riboside transporter PnuC